MVEIPLTHAELSWIWITSVQFVAYPGTKSNYYAVLFVIYLIIAVRNVKKQTSKSISLFVFKGGSNMEAISEN